MYSFQNSKILSITIYKSIRSYISLMKPKIIVLLAITGIVGYVRAPGGSTLLDVSLFMIAGCISAGGAMAINNAIDRDIDAQMKRTQNRASITMIPSHNIVVFGSLLICFASVLAYLHFGIYPTLHLLWGALFYIFGYSMYLKRNSVLNTIIGGLASPAPVWAAYAAKYELTGISTGNTFLGVSLEGWILGLLVFIWTPTHTWAMAAKNYDDYKQTNIPMLPVVLGLKKTAKITLIVGLGVVLTGNVILLWLTSSMNPIIWMIIPNLIMIYGLIKFNRSPSQETGNLSFITHNIWLGIIFVIYALI